MKTKLKIEDKASNQPRICQQKWIRMGLESMPAPTRDVLENKVTLSFIHLFAKLQQRIFQTLSQAS